MISENPLTRIRSPEFFGVLLPGLCLLASAGFGWLAAHSRDGVDLWNRLVASITIDAQPRWYSIVIALFAAYLLGSVLRAFPVWRLDTPLAKLFGIRIRRNVGERMELLYRDPYPYPAMLSFDRQQLVISGCVSASNSCPSFDGCHAHVVLDYCKEYASLRSPAAAERLQEVEARTRLFFGMFGAMGLGSATSLVFALCGWSALPLLWCAASIPFALIFGQRLRFIRGQEARMIYYAYLVQRETDLKATSSADSDCTVRSKVTMQMLDGQSTVPTVEGVGAAVAVQPVP